MLLTFAKQRNKKKLIRNFQILVNIENGKVNSHEKLKSFIESNYIYI